MSVSLPQAWCSMRTGRLLTVRRAWTGASGVQGPQVLRLTPTHNPASCEEKGTWDIPFILAVSCELVVNALSLGLGQLLPVTRRPPH